MTLISESRHHRSDNENLTYESPPGTIRKIMDVIVPSNRFPCEECIRQRQLLREKNEELSQLYADMKLMHEKLTTQLSEIRRLEKDNSMYLGMISEANRILN